MHLFRVSGFVAVSLAALSGCSSDSSPNDGSGPGSDAPAPPAVAPARATASRASMRGPNPFAFHQSVTGAWIAQQQRDRAVFQDEVMKVEDPETGDSISFGTSYVGRSRNLWFGPSTQDVDDDGAITLTRAGIVERYRSFRRATEQAWLFDALPEGTGDLVVRTTLAGVTSADPVATGLVLHTATTDFLYENGTWIDDNGTNVLITPKWTGSGIELTVPASVLATSKFPAVLDPLVGPWSPTPTVTPAYLPAIASNGSGFIAVWEDYTNKSNAARVLARRYDSSGTSLDSTPISVGNGTGSVIEAEPSVAYDGTSYVVAYWDNNNNKSRNRVKVVPIKPSDGTIGTRTTFDTGNTKPSEYSPSIACRSGKCGIAYHQTNNAKAQIIFTSYAWNASTSTATTHATISVTNGNLASYSASAATDGTNVFVVWEQGTVGSAAIGAATIAIGSSSDSVTSATNVTLVSTPTGGEVYAPSTAYLSAGSATGSAKYVVGYSKYSAANSDDAMGRVVTSTASAAPSAGSEATIWSGAGDQDNVFVACASGSCIASLYNQNSVYAVPLSTSTGGASGSVSSLSALNSSTTGARDNPKIAGNGSQFFAVWSDRRSGWYQARGATVSTSGAGGTDSLVSKP